MPQMDIMLSPNPEEEPLVIVGWDEGDDTFLWLYVRQDKEWNQVRLNAKAIEKFRTFLNVEHIPMQNDYICPEAKKLASMAKILSEKHLARAIQDLINTAAEQTAGNIFRSEDDDLHREATADHKDVP